MNPYTFGGKSARRRAVDSEWLPIADAQALLDRQPRRVYAGGAQPQGVTTS